MDALVERNDVVTYSVFEFYLTTDVLLGDLSHDGIRDDVAATLDIVEFQVDEEL